MNICVTLREFTLLMKASKTSKKIVIGTIAIVVIALICFRLLHMSAHHNKKEQAPTRVTIAQVQARDLTITSNAVGSAQPHAAVAVKSQVDGEILSVAFKEGDNVQAGQTLFTIDARSYTVKLQMAKANLMRDEAQLTFANQTLARNAKLVGQGYVAKQDYEKLQSDKAALMATVQSDKAAVTDAELQLDNCTIKAPISGKTGSLAATAGNLVQANEQNPLVTINQIAPIDVKFAVNEKQFLQLKSYMQGCKITIQAFLEHNPKVIKTSVLSFADNTVDQTTGTIQLKASFDNADQYFWPGQFVKIILPIMQLKGALVVPTRAVQMSQNGSFVFVVINSVAKVRPVTLGPNVNDLTVIESGLHAGEAVITEGQLYLADGAHVQTS
jgi:membrane fusion protein, multidrug efflux system